jgi:hypothetical protein
MISGEAYAFGKRRIVPTAAFGFCSTSVLEMAPLINVCHSGGSPEKLKVHVRKPHRQ